MDITPRRAAIDAGRALQAILDQHIELLESENDQDDASAEIDRELWDAVAAYGDALDELYDEDDVDDEKSESDELTFTVRTRYDYTVVDEKAFLSAGQGIGQAVQDLIDRSGKPIGALEVDSLETGSGLLTVHLNSEPLVAADFQAAEEPTDLLLVDPDESLAFVLDEPVYSSRAEAEAAAKLRD
ncbi:MAG TPA: hypothetical protein VGC18_00525 [Lacisediminihabitans sp.]|uniref:hypothetical protein n=1 Tax=Lacisediminihabitans sp. TaxID=2787631 RepID=UPI002ED96873